MIDPNTDSKRSLVILILDDDQFLRDMYALKFKEAGCSVTGAASAPEAAEMLAGGAVPDAILVDVVMPTMDGFDFLKDLRDKGLASNSAIFVLSNLGQPADIERGRQFGVNDYIVKADNTPSQVVGRVLKELEAAP